jgi:hypothetical protein
MNLSERGIQRIIEWETGGENYYERQPEWPGEQSGITIGVGWDLGHTPATETSRAWGGLLPTPTVAQLVAVAGRTGEAAQQVLPMMRHINIPWAAALTVFREVTLPTWYLRTLRIYPQAGELPGDCAAALVSLVFNRGPSLSGDRRSEMRDIQSALTAGELARVPGLLRAMVRLWPNSRGLRRRRTEEADLFEAGLVPAGK